MSFVVRFNMVTPGKLIKPDIRKLAYDDFCIDIAIDLN